jgi:hypothetical protein
MTSGDREGLIELGLKIEGRPDKLRKAVAHFCLAANNQGAASRASERLPTRTGAPAISRRL